MSIDYCVKCDKAIDTDFHEPYQEDGSCVCDDCLDDMENDAMPADPNIAGVDFSGSFVTLRTLTIKVQP